MNSFNPLEKQRLMKAACVVPFGSLPLSQRESSVDASKSFSPLLLINGKYFCIDSSAIVILRLQHILSRCA